MVYSTKWIVAELRSNKCESFTLWNFSLFHKFFTFFFKFTLWRILSNFTQIWNYWWTSLDIVSEFVSKIDLWSFAIFRSSSSLLISSWLFQQWYASHWPLSKYDILKLDVVVRSLHDNYASWESRSFILDTDYCQTGINVKKSLNI